MIHDKEYVKRLVMDYLEVPDTCADEIWKVVMLERERAVRVTKEFYGIPIEAEAEAEV